VDDSGRDSDSDSDSDSVNGFLCLDRRSITYPIEELILERWDRSWEMGRGCIVDRDQDRLMDIRYAV